MTKGAVSQAYARVLHTADLDAIERDETTADQRGTYARLESLAGLSAAIDNLER